MRSETSYELDGDLIVVDAVVVGPAGRAEARLVLDTGAVLTTLVPGIVESIGYTSNDRIAWSVTRTAAANERGYIVQLAQLATVGFAVTDLHVVVAELGYGMDGVLGMNFLSDFNFEIRPAEQRLLMERIAACAVRARRFGVNAECVWSKCREGAEARPALPVHLRRVCGRPRSSCCGRRPSCSCRQSGSCMLPAGPVGRLQPGTASS